MKFRLSIQPKPKEFLSIVPSHLLSDPAFSADPRLNPYSANNQQLAWDTPPQGHPVLKNKNRGPVLSNFALNNGIVALADFDFQLIQPPNSPVSYIGGSGTQHQDPSFPFPTTLNSASPLTGTSPSQVAPPTATAPSLNTRKTAPAASRASIIYPQPPAAKEGKKKKRMPFILSRRKTLQATSSNPSVSLVSKAALPSLDNDAPRAVAGRTVSESVLSAPRGRPVLPPRATTSGSVTPRSMATSISAMSKRPADSVRTKDLDRIDELDETNPLGLSLHHDGPYEAASQALKRGENANPSGGGENSAGLIQGMQAYGRPYFPPQAPVGVSLNLSPGQILPRNFSEQRPSQPPAPPRMRDTSALPPRMQQTYPPVHPSLNRSQSQLVSSQTSSIPPRHLNRMDGRPDAQGDPSRRRQSQPHPPSPGFMSFPNPHPLPNPHPTMRPESSVHSRPDLTISRSQTQLPIDTYVPQVSQPISETNSLYPSSLDSRHDSSNSSISRRRSQNMPRPFVVSNPGPEPPYQATPSVRSRGKDALHLVVAKQTPADDDDSTPFDIGMAMLEGPETPLIPNPRIYLPHGTSDAAEEFNPYDPIHLENEHSRTSSPSALTYDSSSHSSHGPGRTSSRELSRQPSPVRSLEVPKIAPATRVVERSPKQHENPPVERGNIDPPPYSIAVGGNVNVIPDDRKKRARQPSYFHIVTETRASSPSTSPERVSLRQSIRSGPSDDSHYSRQSHQSNPERPTLPPMQPVMNQGVYPVIGKQVSISQQYWREPDVGVMRGPPVQIGPPAVNPEQRSAPPDPLKSIPMLPARRSRERLVPSTMSIPSRDLERDGRSTHQTISTTSSGQHRSGPPRRHVPKHLVMPTPLNNAHSVNANPSGFAAPHRIPPSSPPAHISSRQVPPRRAQVAFQPQAQVYYPPPSSSPLASNVYISPTTKELQEIQITASRKLKKRASVMATPSAVQIPPPPAVTTVSFAPPVVGYGPLAPPPPPASKTVSRLKNEKIPKRVLSKRRTDL